MILSINDVSKSFSENKVLEKFSLEVRRNEILCIIGPSGCGKSTILNLISKLEIPESGEILNLSSKMGYVFQEDRLLPWRTVYENVRLVNDNLKDEEIENLIKDVGLKDFKQSYPRELSGGMKQRTSIARAFAYKSDLLLMDEPLKSLDYNLRLKLIDNLVNIWSKRETTIIYVTHEIDEALLLGNRIAVLSERPATVIEIIPIEISQRERTLNSEELKKIRDRIIKIILGGDNNEK